MASEPSALTPPHSGSHQAPPEDLFQNWLLGAWNGLLGRTDVGIDDDFFALGGTRELCEQLFAEIAKLSNERLSVPEGVGAFTIRGLAELVVARIEARTRAQGIQAPSVPRRGRPVSAQNILHDQLLSLWEDLLATTGFGIEDDFFAVGGTSELAERMLGGIEDLCGQRIEATDFDRLRTIRNLADTLVARLPESAVYEIQAGAPGVPPLFFLHGDFGGGGYYVHQLARGLGQKQPFLALQQHGMHGDDVPPSVEEMAADHARRVRDTWPDGPLHLCGHCASAIIILETARQLARDGTDVASLLLVDPPVRLPQGRPMLPVPSLSPTARRLPRVREAWLLSQYREILGMYRLPVYDGRTIVFWTRDQTDDDARQVFDSPETRAIMQRLAPLAEMRTCPGTHVTALGRHVSSLAAEMRTALSAGGA